MPIALATWSEVPYTRPMSKRLRRTPCMGICSTTYGDLVCRGCKRFAHEIISWNGFDESQRDIVWSRLLELRDTCVRDVIYAGPRTVMETVCSARGRPVEAESSTLSLAYELLRRALNEPSVVAESGINLREQANAIDALKAIDDLFLQRSQAHYERAYKTPVS